MVDILHDLPIKASAADVYCAMTTAHGLEQWWTARSTGEPVEGGEYGLWFGPEHAWRGRVTKCTANSEFELELTRADSDWEGTRVGFRLDTRAGTTWVRFYHKGWPTLNEHYRISCCCWAMYLRILRRYLEYGEFVRYEDRLDV